MMRAARWFPMRCNPFAFVGFVAISVAAALPASAQFMKPGASPESGVAGIWRVIAARPAPWEKSPRTKLAAPLLEYAVRFDEGETKGPASLACAHALYASGVTAPDDLFEGKLKSRGDTGAATLELAGASITTYRVVCDGKTRDYYIDDNANLKTYDAGIIYTLERPAGMEPARYEPGFSGPSFDCSNAKSAGEQTICRDASLSEADRKLDAAYRRLKAGMTPASFATVQKAERDWLAYVTKSCRAGGAMPADSGERGALQSCLGEHYTERADALDGAQVTKAGALTLEPRMRLFTRARPETVESDIYPWLGGGAEAGPFNAYVSKSLNLGQRRMDDKDLFPFGDDVADAKLSARRTYSVHRFDARVASLEIATFDYTGGAHEAIGESSLNWDLVQHRAIALDDVFIKDKPWRASVTDFCMRDLHEQFAAGEAGDPERSAVEQVVGDPGNWLWGIDSASVHFSVYTVASFSGGEFDVDIPYADLEPYLRADAPVLTHP
jgi:uncharacterized protein YecT (DUF1311 family)